MDGYAALAVFQLFDTNDLRDILAVHGIVGRRVGKRDEDTHAWIIGFEPARKINAAFEAFTLTGKSSKWSSRGSEGRTRTGLAILALRATRLSEIGFSSFSGMAAFELESDCSGIGSVR
jgi:hypothetical protein